MRTICQCTFPMNSKKCSILICSLNRKQSLNRLLLSIEKQTFKDYEVIICEEEGNLVELKDKAWRKSNGEILIWLDDDIRIINDTWLENIVYYFDAYHNVVGVTGPTYVSIEYRKNRDIFKGGLFKLFYNWFFLEGRAYYPGRITSCGVNTIGANYNTLHSLYTQEVDFLEPCQFAIRRWVVEEADGFDLSFTGVAEWCDVDLCYRIKKYGKLMYLPYLSVHHYPEIDAVTNKRLDTVSRYQNYCRWADRYVNPSFKNKLYRLFLWSYFKLKGITK